MKAISCNSIGFSGGAIICGIVFMSCGLKGASAVIIAFVWLGPIACTLSAGRPGCKFFVWFKFVVFLIGRGLSMSSNLTDASATV